MSTHELCRYNQDILCDIERIGHRCIINILVFKGSKIYIKFKVFYEKYLTKDLLKGRKKNY